MKLHGLMIAAALTVAACGTGDSNTDPSAKDPSEQAGLGTLSLNLVGADSDGRPYRLRSAEFLIQGGYNNNPFPNPDGGYDYFETTVSSEDNLAAARITLKLVPGYYDVSLTSPGWYLERNTGGTWERVEQAVLLSSAYQYAYVYDGGVVPVNFRFGVDGELIDFRSGDLSIGIEIEQPGEGAPDAGGFPGGLFGGIGGLGGLGGLIDGGIDIDAGVGAAP
jgi:hypothetical protein